MKEEKSYRYKNVSGLQQELMGHGLVESGGIIEVSGIINNENFELIEEPKEESEKKASPKSPSVGKSSLKESKK